MKKQNEFTIDIKDTIGVFGITPSGWTKEINIVSWNGAPPTIDVRAWSADHSKCGKGITLSEKEAREFCDILREHLGYNENVE